MEGRFKVGDYVRILPDAILSDSGYKHGDIAQIVMIEYDGVEEWMYWFTPNKADIQFYEDELEIADDYILKQIWK